MKQSVHPLEVMGLRSGSELVEWNKEWEQPQDASREEPVDDRFLPTISLIHVPHPRIPNLYQRCFEYAEPWQWSPVTELVETGQWFFADRPGSQPHRGSH